MGKKLIYTSYSSNTRAKDLWASIALLFTPWAWKNGGYAKKVQREFEKRFPISKPYTFNYARSGMYVLFKSLNLQQPTNEVVVQGFTCIAAVNPIIWANGKPIYADINVKTFNLDIESVKSKITKNTKAIMFQHTFGNSSGIDEIKQICKENNLLLIEDCANTIFGKHKNKLIGSFGDVAIFSFGRDKAISSVNGGLILVNNQNLIPEFEKAYNTLTYPSTIWIFKQLIYQPIWSFIKATYNIKIGKLVHFITIKTNILTKATSLQEKKGEIINEIPCLLPNSLAKLAYIQLKDIDLLNRHRLEINKIYEKELDDVGSVKYESGNVLLRYPILLKDKNKALNYFKSKYMQLFGDWYDKPITPIEIDFQKIGYTRGSCTKSEKISNGIVNLPNHINISDGDAKSIVKTINDYYVG